jgi:large subunit ribosomal protein L15
MPSRTYKFRGQRTHGRGKKSGRGAGKMGGRGNSGLHKHKHTAMLKYAPDHFGRHGFKRHVTNEVNPINIRDLNIKLESLKEKGHAKMSGHFTEINLEAAGYTKLLGVGIPAGKFKITVAKASGNAIEKVKGAGGEVVSQPEG